jgi:hypothetical protein
MKNMMKIFAIALLLTLIGCVSAGGKLVKAGSTVPVFDMEMQTSLDWAKQRWGRFETWTIDGGQLNEFVVFSKIKPRENVFLGFRETKRHPDGTWYKLGMRPDELRDLILDGMRNQGLANVESSNLRPASVSGATGIRFEMKFTNANGLNYGGTVMALERNERLTVLVWDAPLEYYHGRDIEAVNKLIDSVRFVK